MLDRLFRHANGRSGVVYVSERDLSEELAAVARELGLSTDEAFAKLDRGELDGTSAELRLRTLRYLKSAKAEISPRVAA